MKIAAVISEYNPFHNGHLYHLNKTREQTNADAVITIMSGNFVQRGLPASIDKWSRAKTAIDCGIDLVIELPALYSLSSAEIFAYGAVSLLNSLNVIDYLSFGSESGNIEDLKKIANIIAFESDDYKRILKLNLKTGLPFHKARFEAIKYCTNNSDITNLVKTSNNILALEYIKHLIKLESSITPVTIKRLGGDYNSQGLNSSYSSATAIRKHLNNSTEYEHIMKHVPEKSFEIIENLYKEGSEFSYEDKMVDYLKYKMFSSKDININLPEASEGIENKIFNALKTATTFDDLVSNIKTKRYTYTRISRILCQYFIGFDEYNIETLRKETCPYARILGANSKGREVLKLIKKSSDIKLISNIHRGESLVSDLENQSSYAYSLLNNKIDYDYEYKKKPYIII
ncbi:MAG: nucleotidyltransferase [Clostridiaceae bacterium]